MMEWLSRQGLDLGPIEISESKDLRFHTVQFVWLSNRRQQNSNSFLGVWRPLLGTIDQSSTQWLKLLSPKIIHRSFRVFLFTCAKLWPFPIRQEYQALSVCTTPRRKLAANYCCWFSTILKRCGTANFWVSDDRVQKVLDLRAIYLSDLVLKRVHLLCQMVLCPSMYFPIIFFSWWWES